MRIYPRDGRVRNPVPSKLKNVNEQMKGNFGVMHMDVASHRASEGRDAAAKRTSEGTALQAKLAQTDGYVSHQRRANYPRPPGLKQFTPNRAKPTVNIGPPRPLTFEETKTEQARLLTLLRTLPPNTVVDQICRALGFFGGVPTAPPPADGKFPESAEANGPGNLFVGWITEIFPDPDNPRPRYVENSAGQAAGPKRPRGRPKGSKASKARIDKGLKKGSQKTNRGANDGTEDPQDDSWVDVEDSVMETNDSRNFAEAMAALRNAPSTPARRNTGGNSTTTPGTSSAAGFRSINDANAASGSNSKKRGRPKGSKNRPKDKVVVPAGPPSKVTPIPPPVPMVDGPSKTKASSAKSKQAKNRPRHPADGPSNDTAVDASGQQQQQQQHSDANISGLPSDQAQAGTLGFGIDTFTTSTANGAVTHENPQSSQNTSATLPPSASQVKASTVTAKKRKRPTGNGAGQVSAPSGSQHAQPSTTPVASSTQLQNQTTQPIAQPTSTSVVAPPSKRVRKSQESSSVAMTRRQTPSNMGQKASAPPAPAMSEAEDEPNSGDVITQSHPPAEGLEAHYAVMQSHTDQMQNYTNNRPQLKQPTHSSGSMGSTVSPAPAAAPAPAGGLDAHYEHFAALQNLSDSPRQAPAGRQKQQRPAQTPSPIPTQSSKPPRTSAASTSQQQSGASQPYFPQGQGIGSSYNSQQQTSYSSAQRPQQHISSTSPNTGLVQHVTNSPQFSTQSNSPLMQAENNFRSSPSLIHNNGTFTGRRTTSASPLDNSTYRSNSTTSHGVTNHSPHFSARQTSSTTAHNTSHPGLSSTFPTFSEPSLFDMSLESNGSHGNIGIGGNSYGLNSGAVPQQQRSSSSNAASLYSSSGMNNTYLGSTGIGRAGQSNRWTS